jgi:hypothetical protein
VTCGTVGVENLFSGSNITSEGGGDGNTGCYGGCGSSGLYGLLYLLFVDIEEEREMIIINEA